MHRLALVATLAACGSPTAAGPVAPTALTSTQQQRDAARVPLATQVVDAYSNAPSADLGFVARWSPDGATLLFASTRDGVPEIYAADPDAPAAPPRALTTGPERAPVGQLTADGRHLVYLRDHGADESYEIWRADADGSHAVSLTPGEPLHRGEPLLPRAQPDQMLYSAMRTTSADLMLLRQDLAGGPPAQVYVQHLPGALMDVTPDGARALMAELRADNDITVTEVDVATGAAHRVWPPAGAPVGVYAAQYSASGTDVFVSTDTPTGVELVTVDARTGSVRATYRDAIPTSPLSILASPLGDALAIGVDAGTHGEVRILDAATLTVRHTVAAPLGEIQLGAWKPDGSAFSVSISRADAPDDPFAVSAATGEATPLRTDARPGLATLPPLTVTVTSTPAFDGLTLPINVYLPAHAAGARLPVIASFHGGPSASSAVHWAPSTRFLTALGFAVIEPNVRGSTGFGRAFEMADNREHRADWLRDLHTINAWVKAQPWCDPDRVAIFGGSYGGYTTLMALSRFPTEWAAGVDAFGPADLQTFLRSTEADIRAGFVPEFGDVDRDAALLAEFSPLRQIDRIVRPLFVYAGQNDPRVPRRESDALVAALRARHVPVEYVVAPDEGHSLDRRENRIAVLAKMARFLEDAFTASRPR